MININKIFGFEVFGPCLFWRKKKILVVGDLHLGYEENLISRGILIPRTQFQNSEEILQKILQKTGKLNKIILLGDVKHVFGKILRQEMKDFKKLIEILDKSLYKLGKIIITKGNHDPILEKVIENYKKVEILENFVVENTLFLHGDAKSVKKSYKKIKNKQIRLIILGHFHPSYLLKDKKSIKEEKYKCFLYGKSKEFGKKVIFVPSFFPLIEGSDIIEDLEIYEKGMKIILLDENGESYDFGKI
jgi:uncharacterized protein